MMMHPNSREVMVQSAEPWTDGHGERSSHISYRGGIWHETSSKAPCRPTTAAAHYQVVERVIGALRARLSEPLSLDDIASMGISSRYHFDRVFRQVTGLTPFQFLAALRLEAAKRLLVTTQRSVTGICYDVGYNSIGTFTTLFRQHVGVSPRTLRQASRDPTLGRLLEASRSLDAARHCGEPALSGLSGRIFPPLGFAGTALVGFFGSCIPSARPVACGTVGADGCWQIGSIPDGEYYVFALGFASSADLLQSLVQDPSLRGRAGPIAVRAGVASGPIDITLRPPRPTDPPIIVALPILMAERARSLAGGAEARAEA